MLRVNKLASFLLLLAAVCLPAYAAGGEGGGVSPAAAKLVALGHGWSLTNSMVTGWVI